jgi:NADH-quinone oxidoreductase subunit L
MTATAMQTLLTVLSVTTVASPALLLGVLGLPSLIGRPLGERWTARCIQVAVLTGLAASLAILAAMLIVDTRQVAIELGQWVSIPDQHFHFTVKLLFDRLSVPFVILSFLLCGIVGKFASVYLHREPGYQRFFLMYALFLLGMVLASVAGTMETLFVGWEFVGLSSALLVAFFQERPGPVRNGHRIWTVYRLSDAALLMAAIALHHVSGEGDFARLAQGEAWPSGAAALSSGQALLIGMLLVIAAAGKSALVPFSGWLPRAMEGPTPSSAVFYGALSVHLGAFLLLRVSPILERSALLCALLVVLGAITALHGTLVGRAQTDIKSSLSYASLTQLGIIVVEIGLGFRYLALVHILGHACLRTLQFLRAPSLLKDYHALENALGERLSHPAVPWSRWIPADSRHWLYRFALERCYLDAVLHEYVAQPFLKVFRVCNDLEQQWTALVNGEPRRGERPRTSAPQTSSPLDELS